MDEMTIQEYLKFEILEARQDQKDRVKFQDKIARRFNELAAVTAKASTKDEVDNVVRIVNSWLINFEALETDRQEYLGDIPEGYLVDTWKDFVREWKPKFRVLKESAEFKASTIKPVEYKQPAKQFKTTLTDRQRAELADLLAEGGFIPAADKTALIGSIGGEIEGNRFKPVKWLKNKQLLREFLTPLKGFSDLRTTDIEHLCPELFTDSKGNPINLANNKVVPCTDSDKIKGYYEKIATI